MMNLQGVTRELSLSLESRVREGLLASGVGWSLVLCLGAAYACYYLSSIAKSTENLSLEQVDGDEYQARTVRCNSTKCPIVIH